MNILLVRPGRAVIAPFVVVAFELFGRAAAEPGVAPFAVVPALDPVEDRRLRLLPGGDERPRRSSFSSAAAGGQPPARARRRRARRASPTASTSRPRAAEAIEHRGEVEPAFPGRDLLDIRTPEPVRRARGEVAPDQARGRPHAPNAQRRLYPCARSRNRRGPRSASAAPPAPCPRRSPPHADRGRPAAPRRCPRFARASPGSARSARRRSACARTAAAAPRRSGPSERHPERETPRAPGTRASSGGLAHPREEGRGSSQHLAFLAQKPLTSAGIDPRLLHPPPQRLGRDGETADDLRQRSTAAAGQLDRLTPKLRRVRPLENSIPLP